MDSSTDSPLPVAVAAERAMGRNVLATPFGPVYDLSNQLALGYLLQKLTAADDADAQAPYRYFSRIAQTIHQHLRSLAENVDSQDSSLTWHIVKTNEHICRTPGVVRSAVSNVGAVAVAYAKLGTFHSPYTIADLLRPLLCVERFAVATGDQAVIQQIDAVLGSVLESIEEGLRAGVGEAVAVRRSQIEDDLRNGGLNVIDRNNSIGRLAQMLGERGLLR